MSRFRLQCSDTQWDTFCEEVAFGRLQALAGSCTFNTEEFVHIGREIEGLVLRSEQAFDELQGRIAQGEVISSREIDEISRYLVEELSEEARPTRRVFNSRDELFDTAAVVLRREEEGETIQEAEERVRNVYRDHRTLCGVYHSRLEHSVGSVISGIRRIQIPGRELLEEDATDEEIFNGLDRSLNRDIAIATDRGILHNLDLLCAEIEHHSDRTPIQEQQRDLEAYSTLLEEAIRVFGDREETLQVAVEQCVERNEGVMC